MPSSYNFKMNDPPSPEAPSSIYKPSSSSNVGGVVPPPALSKNNNKKINKNSSKKKTNFNNDLSNSSSNNYKNSSGVDDTANGGGGSSKSNKMAAADLSKNVNELADKRKSSNTGKTNGVADDDAALDAKWKASYVPTLYDPDKFASSENANANGNSSGASRKTSSTLEDVRDAKWKSNYVPTPYYLDKVEIEEGQPPKAQGSGDEDGPASVRPQWASKGQSILSCLGLSIGIGNVIRFPYLAYKYGGGAFLLPYALFLVLVGMPLYFLELGIGQYSQLGPLNVWKCSTAMQGIGMAMLMLSLLTSVYYNQLMAYCLYYFFATLAYIGHPLPWATCGHPWSTNNCYELHHGVAVVVGNTTIIAAAPIAQAGHVNQTAAYQYFRNQVLHQPVFGHLSDALGTIRWDLTLCLLLSWMLVFVLLVRGVKTTGRAAYLLTPLPCIALVVLMITGLLMRGADRGLLFLFVPKWEALLDMEVWTKALEQVLFSLSLAYGGVIMFGSYNKFRNKVHLDAIGICLADFVVSIVSSVAVFSVLGAMAYTLDLHDLSDLPDLGHSLAFVSYPSAISSVLPLPHLWALLFFGALFLLGLTSLAGHVHTLVGGLQDTIPRLRCSTAAVAGVLCCCCFLLGVPLCAEQRGFLLLELLSRYGVGLSVLAVAVCELLTLSWLYGVQRLSQDFSFMLAYAPSMFWKLCWAFVSPAIILAALIYSIIVWKDPDVDPVGDPSWALYLRWTLTAVSVAFIPLVFLIMFLRRLFTMKLRRLFSPALCWGPGEPEARRQLLAARTAGGEDNLALAY